MKTVVRIWTTRLRTTTMKTVVKIKKIVCALWPWSIQ